MALNPVAYTEKVVGNFLRYQLTAYPFADPELYAQMRALLSLDTTRNTPLMRGPYVSLSRSFRAGASMSQLVAEGLAHPLLAQLHPYPTLYGHQERAYRAIVGGHSTLVSTGTGSGKSECFFYPILSRCLQLRDQGAPAGITAVIVYPMNALAEDQLGRLRDLLAGTGISFGMYVGKTPEKASDVAGKRLKTGASRADYQAALEKAQKEQPGLSVHPAEERCSREEMRTPGQQPRILLTNVKQLELLLTRQSDVELFDSARLDFLVFDEAHTYGGAAGGETSCLIRRLRAYCGKDERDTVCIATSATIADTEKGPEAGKDFAARFFGVPRENVALVGEEYESDVWAKHLIVPPPLPGTPADHLRAVLAAVDADTAIPIVAAYGQMTGRVLPEVDWQEALHQELSTNRVVYELADILKRPLALADLVVAVSGRVGRAVPEEETLIWLALGAAARAEGRPLLRPVVHNFVRGVGGAVVTFPTSGEHLLLHLTAEDAEKMRGSEKIARLPIVTCYTCGQHYFTHHVADFTFTGDKPGGGEAVGTKRVWLPLEESQGGKRVMLIDSLIAAEEDDDDPARTAEVYLCRSCGTLHNVSFESCGGCGRDEVPVRLLAIQQKSDDPGKLTRCISCGTQGRRNGGRYREPTRAVRANTVSDVHILAQDMVNNAERARLLVFCDNRQDAAFQAGWMRDHARRFRLRSLMAQEINKGALSVGDLTATLDKMLEEDDPLSRALAPEVWNVLRKETQGVKHAEERKRYLRIQVLREIVSGAKNRQGLEPVGRIRIEYAGLTQTVPFVTEWATRLGLEADRFTEGIAGLLDRMRRSLFLLDREGHQYTRMWQDGDYEVMRGYLPMLKGVPKGLKLERDNPAANRLMHWLGTSGDTSVRQIARTWGVPKEGVDVFVRALWAFLVDDLKVIVLVTLNGSKGKPLPNCEGAHQVDADCLKIVPNKGLWRCKKCRRAQPRPMPLDRCLAWRCDGILVFEPEDADNYDLEMLDNTRRMLRPQEHSAQVPSNDRERLELLFKGQGEAINTLVATPTLELGVDIGALDAVLMRNVPPLPANYWQRAGRAGRRHRMAVNITYARPASHDQAYFANPAKMLEGRVEPPHFNLRNELMVAKHIHATVITRLHQLTRNTGALSVAEREEIAIILETVLPRQIKQYLFDATGNVCAQLYDVSPLNAVITKHTADLSAYVESVFAQGWPAEDNEVVTAERLKSGVTNMTAELQNVIKTLKKRLDWALDQMRRLDERRKKKGTLDPDEDALYARCDRLIKRYKGQAHRSRHEAEGHDDTNTYNVLAAEGFLPGYGLEIGAIIGTANLPKHLVASKDFELPRPASIAVREYVPGNMIYANGHRFVPRYFHLQAMEEPLRFQVDAEAQAVSEAGIVSVAGTETATLASLSLGLLPAVPICDVDMSHISHISDDEEYRFQMPVSVFGYELGRHSGGKAYQWGARSLLHRRGVHLRMVNIGPTSLVNQRAFGYPACLVCGQSRSPFSSQAEREHFVADHEERCGRRVEQAGFYADVVADALMLPDCATRDEAYSMAEAIRTGAAQVLEMEKDDIDILVIGKPGVDACDALLVDPMPGGSGLIDQILARFGEVAQAALTATRGCSSGCARACIDCLYTFRNGFFHAHLNRKLAADLIDNMGVSITLAHDIPPQLPTTGPTGSDMPVNNAEALLKSMLESAAFPAAEWHKQIMLGKPLGSTSPDCFWPGDEDDPGTCVYLDGLSAHIHGNAANQENDYAIRTELRNRDYHVIEIAATDLYDKGAMAGHFYRLARVLIGKDKARAIRDNTAWFD